MIGRMLQMLGLTGMVLLSSAAAAQQSGSIAGVVSDTSGAVLPGVTVEASSPALIEKVRTVVTDSRGLYQIVDLPPGEYAVTFTLPAFQTVRREGIVLTTGFSANVTAQMPVGDLHETLTVAAASPVVDLQNVNQQEVMTREVMDTIPSGKGWANLVPLVPGVVMSNASSSGVAQDVGGATGFNFTMGAIHGGCPMDEQVVVNGMTVASLTGPGESRTNWSDGLAQEYNVELAAHPADVTPYGGVFMNLIPKEGGNRFSGSLFTSFGTAGLQGNNLDSVLRSEGFTVSNSIKDLVDVNPGFGGPLVRDRLWFYTQYRYYRADSYVGGQYYNATPAAWTYQADLGRPALNDQLSQDPSVNLTWQVSPKNKITALYAYELMCLCHFGVSPTVAPEASTYNNAPSNLLQVAWMSTISNRLLLDVGAEYYTESFLRNPEPDATQPSIVEQSTGLRFRSGASYSPNPQTIDDFRASLSYITGGHSLKVGIRSTWEFAKDPSTSVIGNVNYRTLNGVPNQVTFWTTPYPSPKRMYPVAIYAQDQFKLSRLTIDAGLRFDRFTSSYEAVTVGPVQYLPVSRNYPSAQVLDWKDVSPRLGAVYDPFGTGKTAIKVSLSRYVAQEGETNTNAIDPIIAATNSVTRTWTDANHDFAVQGDPLNPAANGELGPSPNNLFGTPNSTFSFDPSWARGWGVRPFNWQTAVTVQHELLPRVALEGSFNRRAYGNFIVDDNVLVNPGSYDPYCIAAPADPRLPGGGGQQICGLYDLNPKYVGQVQTVRMTSAKFGNQYDHWTDFGLAVRARLANGVLVQGGVDSGKQVTDTCDVVTKINNPSTYLCHQESPFLTQVKLLATYPLPWWGVQASGTFQSRVPDPTGLPTATGTGGFDVNYMGMSANYVATNAQIAPSLGRNLSAGAGSNVTVNVINPGALYPPRINQTDLRVAKSVSIRQAKLQVFIDLFNLFNANTGLRFNNTYGTNGSVWNNPTAIMPARLVRLGAQLRF
jgi:hypothetical protein